MSTTIEHGARRAAIADASIAPARHRATVGKAYPGVDPYRVCIACHGVVADRDGVCWFPAGVLVHRGACDAMFTAARRVYDRSPRGRHRPVREAIALVEGRGCPTCAPALPWGDEFGPAPADGGRRPARRRDDESDEVPCPLRAGATA